MHYASSCEALINALSAIRFDDALRNALIFFLSLGVLLTSISARVHTFIGDAQIEIVHKYTHICCI